MTQESRSVLSSDANAETLEASDPTLAFRTRASASLASTFARARASSEFEYACALLRVRGMEDQGWDPLIETHQLVADMLGLLQGPFRDDTRLRLALLTYCHLTEVDAIYSILANMLLVVEGERCHVSPFHELYGKAPAGSLTRIPPSAKRVVKYLVEHAERCLDPELAAILNLMFDDQIRNSFFHSDYIIFGGEYRTREGRFLVNGIYQQSLTVDDLALRLNRGLAFYQAFMDAYSAAVLEYRANRVVQGRLHPDGETEVAVELLADPKRGLYGFRTPPQEASDGAA